MSCTPQHSDAQIWLFTAQQCTTKAQWLACHKRQCTSQPEFCHATHLHTRQTDKTTQQPQVHAQSLQGCDVNTETACKTSVLTHHSTWHLAQPKQCRNRKHKCRNRLWRCPIPSQQHARKPPGQNHLQYTCANPLARQHVHRRQHAHSRSCASEHAAARQLGRHLQQCKSYCRRHKMHCMINLPHLCPFCDLPGLEQASLTCSRELLQACIAVIAFKCLDVLTVGRFCVAAAAAGTHCNRMRPATSSRCQKAMT